MFYLVLASAIFACIYLYFKQIYSNFESKGVKTYTPIIMNNLRFLLKIDHIVDQMTEMYQRFSDEKFVGRFDLVVPMIVIRDIDLIKKITIKDFEHFADHRTMVDQSVDAVFGRNLFSLKGQEWKEMRSSLSPAFTSSKIRLMVPFMLEVGEQMINDLKKKTKESRLGYIDVDVKDMTTRYANDVIASCAFGLSVDSHAERENQFYERAKEASTFDFKRIVVVFALISMPKLMKALNVSFTSKATKTFFKSLVTSTIEEREKRNIIRPDMIHLLMEVKKGTLSHDEHTTQDDSAGFATVEESQIGKKKIQREWSDDDLTAQAVIFLAAGFDTVATAMTFLIYELAVNHDIQQRLYQEIMDNEARNGGKIDYNSIQNMVYMDMVVSELLRKWPPAIALDRACVKDYNLGKPNANAQEDLIVRKGENISILVWPIHHDPTFYPDPEKFDPERFSNENKHKIKPFTYIPFGSGPRNCIGSRFALCEVKVVAYQLLKAMELSPAEKTCIPAKLEPSGFNLKMQGGEWVRMTPRQK